MLKEHDEVPGSQKGVMLISMHWVTSPQAPSGKVWGIHGAKKHIIFTLEDTCLVRNPE